MEAEVNPEYEDVIRTIKTVSNYDFSEYSEKSLARRLTKVMMDFRLSRSQLMAQLRDNDLFVEEVVKKITVNTTELFRDPAVWREIGDEVLKPMEQKPSIKIWHAGCSSGQEVYSMAILLSEMGLLDKTTIYATDINADMLERAKCGIYRYRFNHSYLDNLDLVFAQNPPMSEAHRKALHDKYIRSVPADDLMFISPELLNKPIFLYHDLTQAADIFADIRFDLIVCRNVVIYFNHTLQNRVFDLFAKKLQPNGALWLGKQESILHSSLFVRRGSHYVLDNR